MDDREKQLQALLDEHDLLAVYLFGSRADDGLALLEGKRVVAEGSDLDVGVVFRDGRDLTHSLSWYGPLLLALEDVFAPLVVDLVPLQGLDALFQYEAIEGHRIAVSDETESAYYELGVMRRAAELLPIQRQLEQDWLQAKAS